MDERELHVVTGAFNHSGKYITTRLLEEGRRVRTLTNSFNRPNPFNGEVEALPFHFDDHQKLVESFRGARVFYNTYWVRFSNHDFSHAEVIENTRRLFAAAREAGVERIVHASVTNASVDSPLGYFSGKAHLESVLADSGLSYAILRPAVLYSREDVFINNIAWILRNLPVFGVFGDGKYRLQPIFVDDFARLAVEQGRRRENCVIEAIGPETFTYLDLVRAIGEAVGVRRPLCSVPPWFGCMVGSLLGKLVGDMIVTREEVCGLMDNLLYVDAPAAGKTRLTEWMRGNADALGRRYASERARFDNRMQAYENL